MSRHSRDSHLHQQIEVLSAILFIQFSSDAQLCPTLCNPMDCSMPGLPVHRQLPEFSKLMFIDSVMPSNHLILCHPLLPPSIFPSIRIFSNESALRIRWPKYWSFSFSISPSNEHSGLISFRMDWLDLLAVQRTLKSLLQHHSSKASFLWCSSFFTVQLSHPYMTTGKTIALTRWTFVGKVMSLLFSIVIVFITSSIVWPQVNNREGTQPHPSTESWIKDLLNMTLPIRTRPNFPLSQSLPSRSFHKPLILLHQRANRLNTTITAN